MWESTRKYDGKYDNGSAFTGTSLSVRCYESHPSLKIGKGRVHGGSASYPVVKDADIYVSLQAGSASGRQSDPWDTQKVIEVYYPITDMQAPVDVERFKKLVTWLGNQLHKGKSIHLGCIGGHGRTGTLLSALVATVMDKQDAIQYVRKHYCKKAVESKAQVQFLMKHYGVTEAKPTKGELKEWSSGTAKGTSVSGYEYDDREYFAKNKKLIPEGVSAATKSFAPMASSRSLWSPRAKRKS